MTRRDFLVRTAGGAVLLAPSGRTAVDVAGARPAIPAIDTHVHFYDPTRAQGVPWPPKTDELLYRPYLPDAFQKLSAPHHIVGAVVIEASAWVEDNDWLLELVRENPLIVGVVGNLEPGRAGFREHLSRFAANPLFRGLRLSAAALQRTVADRTTSTDMARVVDANLSIDVLGGPAVLPATFELARRFPSLRIIIDHLPFKAWDGNVPALRNDLAELAGQSNVFMKVSEVVRRAGDGVVIEDATFYRPTLDALVDLFGPNRLVYGSNWPVSERVAPYRMVHRVVSEYFASRTAAVAEGYFWRNSLAAYRWQKRGASAALVP